MLGAYVVFSFDSIDPRYIQQIQCFSYTASTQSLLHKKQFQIRDSFHSAAPSALTIVSTTVSPAPLTKSLNQTTRLQDLLFSLSTPTHPQTHAPTSPPPHQEHKQSPPQRTYRLQPPRPTRLSRRRRRAPRRRTPTAVKPSRRIILARLRSLACRRAARSRCVTGRRGVGKELSRWRGTCVGC